LLVELQAMERDHAMHDSSGTVEKLLERTRAGQQLLVFVQCVVEEHRPKDASAGEASPPPPGSNEHPSEPLRRDVPLLRSTAKYLLTACDRLRRSSLHDAWQQLRSDAQSPRLVEVQLSLGEAKLWDLTMRELSLHHGVLHPLSELVEPLPLGEAELAQLGIPCEELLNGQDLLAS
jgi:hypothetical protein